MAPIISVSNVWKRYWIRHGNEPAQTLGEELTRLVSTPLRALARGLRGASKRGASTKAEEEFWALRDVSFEVEPGEVLGIIGSNGAGKSTLLKVLSRITEPTRGSIALGGRVASLLEVGTGFHHELTGRENIFLNGTILGMSRREIQSKFDEIVAFAEIEKFLDTPVKRYSSGMYMRLAFAVAAHLEPEILVVDEVLAVGDVQFQRKCIGKMQDVANKQGRTVLFVSHQMGAVRQLCTRAILMRRGEVAQVGTVKDVIDGYMEQQMGGRPLFTAGAARDKEIALESAWTSNQSQQIASHFVHDEPINVHIACRVNRWLSNVELRLVVEDSRGRRVFTSDVPLEPPPEGESLLNAEARIPAAFLRPENFFVTLCVFVNNQATVDSVVNALSFTVRDGGSKYAASEGVDYGCVFGPCTWKFDYGERAALPLPSASNAE